MSQNKHFKVLIAGGGIGGITTLLALRARGIAADFRDTLYTLNRPTSWLRVTRIAGSAAIRARRLSRPLR